MDERTNKSLIRRLIDLERLTANLRAGSKIAVTYNTGWADLAGFAGCSFYKAADRVYLVGACYRASGALTSPFTLPVGYRPGAAVNVPIVVFGAISYVSIDTAGVVTPSATFGTPATATILDGVSFRL